jgi:hypothetical protein
VERHTGIHIGLGAELSETSETHERVTSRHMDLMLATGVLRGDAGPILMW